MLWGIAAGATGVRVGRAAGFLRAGGGGVFAILRDPAPGAVAVVGAPADGFWAVGPLGFAAAGDLGAGVGRAAGTTKFRVATRVGEGLAPWFTEATGGTSLPGGAGGLILTRLLAAGFDAAGVRAAVGETEVGFLATGFAVTAVGLAAGFAIGSAAAGF